MTATKLPNLGSVPREMVMGGTQSPLGWQLQPMPAHGPEDKWRREARRKDEVEALYLANHNGIQSCSQFPMVMW